MSIKCGTINAAATSSTTMIATAIPNLRITTSVGAAVRAAQRVVFGAEVFPTQFEDGWRSVVALARPAQKHEGSIHNRSALGVESFMISREKSSIEAARMKATSQSLTFLPAYC